MSHLGGLTTLINCAGVLMPGAIGTTASLKDFEHNFAGNTRSVFEMMEHSIPHLKERSADGSCSIVNISSVNGLQSFGGVATYCAAKAAVDMLTKCAALDLAPFGIRANAVNPGLVLTELQKRGGLNDEQYAALVQRSLEVTHPLFQSRGRAPDPSEVADLIAFLASDKALFVTGDSIKIDGGRTRRRRAVAGRIVTYFMAKSRAASTSSSTLISSYWARSSEFFTMISFAIDALSSSTRLSASGSAAAVVGTTTPCCSASVANARAERPTASTAAAAAAAACRAASSACAAAATAALVTARLGRRRRRRRGHRRELGQAERLLARRVELAAQAASFSSRSRWSAIASSDGAATGCGAGATGVPSGAAAAGRSPRSASCCSRGRRLGAAAFSRELVIGAGVACGGCFCVGAPERVPLHTDGLHAQRRQRAAAHDERLPEESIGAVFKGRCDLTRDADLVVAQPVVTLPRRRCSPRPIRRSPPQPSLGELLRRAGPPRRQPAPLLQRGLQCAAAWVRAEGEWPGARECCPVLSAGAAVHQLSRRGASWRRRRPRTPLRCTTTAATPTGLACRARATAATRRRTAGGACRASW